MTFSETIFVDAGAWFALADKNDANHRKAAGIYPALLSTSGRLITSNLVIAEAYILILMELGHAAASDFLERIQSSPRIARAYSTENIESEARVMLDKYRDHDFSYTDAVSFTIMKRQKIGKAFAFDKHFLTAGFLTVP
jgi:predicted nucleic acid-binding protein